ncbi:IclR family transcriptional regulator [Robertmurraya sp. FSL W8-0741]|uniref:IclR family transcriptional regulator n=1 Tax=Robertmurraya sp. FSL W8-0741 TaxID=2954629 RepID=UPI0030FBF04D
MNEKNSTLDNLLVVLETISLHPNGITLTEIVRQTNIPKTTVHRIVNTLKNHEFIEVNGLNESYTIGIKTLEIGIKGLMATDVAKASIPLLQELSEEVGETTFLAVYNNTEIIYLYKQEGTNAIGTTAKLGSRRPAYCTGLGRVILAHLPSKEVERNLKGNLKKYTSKTMTDPQEIKELLNEVRRKGYAQDNEEIEEGLTCFAAPIFDHLGNVIAAVSIAGPTQRMEINKESNISNLLQSAEKISQRLGYFK